MRVVVVMNEGRIAVGVVAARMAPVERTPAHQDREERGEASSEQSITHGAQPHRIAIYLSSASDVNGHSRRDKELAFRITKAVRSKAPDRIDARGEFLDRSKHVHPAGRCTIC